MSFLFPLSLVLPALLASPAQTAANAEQQMVDEILGEVSQIRGLAIKRQVPAVSHSRDKILSYVTGRIAEEYPGKTLDHEAMTLKHLGLIPKQLDYRGTLEEFVTAQVAGYFDPFKDRFVLASWLGSLMQRPIIAHELVHALQHQHFGLKSALTRVPNNDDATVARSAIIEGDATIAMVAHMMRTTDVNQLDEAVAKMGQSIANSPSLTTRHVPHYMKAGLTFPYVGALPLLIRAMRAKGFAGVDDLHRNPPVSTEQLLHPERYPNDRPVAVEFTLPGSTTGRFKPVVTNRFGELGLRFLISPHGNNDAKAKRLTKGWGGDRFRFLTDGKRGALVAAISVDDDGAATRYRELLETTFRHRFSKPPRVGPQGQTVSDGYQLRWTQKGRCLAWVEAPVGQPAEAWLKAALVGCMNSR